MAARPEAVSGGLPVLRILVALFAQMLCCLRRLRVGGVCAGLFDDFTQHVRIFEHRARTQMVLVERLTVVIRHENRALERLKQRAVADVRVGVVDEHARINVAVGVDVQVAMQPPTYSPSFWKSIAKIGLVARISRIR